MPALILSTALTGCDDPDRAVHPTAPGSAPRLALAAAGTEMRLTTDPADQWQPAIFRTQVVYADARNVDPSDPTQENMDIYLWDIGRHTERQVTTNSSRQLHPDIDHDRVVYVDSRNEVNDDRNTDVYLYNLRTDTETQLTTDPSTQAAPSISGDRVTYQDERIGNFDLYLFDLAAASERPIVTDPTHQGGGAISGDLIAFSDVRNGDIDVYLFDLRTNTETRLTTSSANQYQPAISGSRIVYADDRNGNEDIYLFDLGTNVETRLTTDPADQTDPDIAGEQVVYEDNRNGNLDIYLFIMRAQPAFPFAGFFSPVDNPDVAVNVVRAGSSVPVKFSLGGDRGLDIFATDADGSAYPKAVRVACDPTDAPDGIEETASAGASGLSYDPTADRYTYVWKTNRSWAGTCRQLAVQLVDGTTHVADFKFTK